MHGDFCFFNSLGSFTLKNSKLFGCGTWTFGILQSDSFIVDNVEVRWSPVPISSANAADNVMITDSRFIEVGLYYTNFYYMDTAFPISTSPPFAIAGKYTSFTNCLFQFYDPIGMIRAPFSVFEQDYTNDQDTSNVDIISSEFIVANPDTTNAWDEGIFDIGFTFFEEANALIYMENNTQLRFIGNMYEGNDIDETVPLIKIDNNIAAFTNCILNNNLSNYALNIVQGKVVPCHLLEIVDLVSTARNNDACLLSLGALDPSYGNSTSSYFTKQTDYEGPLVVINGDSAAFGLDSGIFSIESPLSPAATTIHPTKAPTINPTKDPAVVPTSDPTNDPTIEPTNDPSRDPTADPTLDPTQEPTTDPRKDFTSDPTIEPTQHPSNNPTKAPFDASVDSTWSAVIVNRGWLIMTDTQYPKNASLNYNFEADVCEIICYRFDNGWGDITQLISYCDHTNQTNIRMTSLEEYAELGDFQAAFSFANTVKLRLDDNSVYPGGKFYLQGLELYDANNLLVEDYTSAITTNLLIQPEKSTANLDIDIKWKVTNDSIPDGCNTTNCYTCSDCSAGLVIQSFTVEDLLDGYEEFEVRVSLINDSTSLTAASFKLSLTECPPGLGIEDDTKQCAECEKEFFSFYDTIDSCYACNETEGISCPGQNEVIINVDWWFQLNDNDTASNAFLVSDCPTGYCCQSTQGCVYTGDDEDTSLCAVGRDVYTPMCGSCKEGLSEYIGSVDCGPCENPAAAYYNILVFMLTLAFCWYQIYFSKYSDEYVNQLLALQMKNSSNNTNQYFDTFSGYFWDKWRMLRVQLYKPIMYYFQSLTFILQQGGITVYLLPLLNIFNLSIDIDSGNEDGQNATGFCLYRNLSAKGEIAIGYMIPGFLLLQLGSIYLFFRIFCKIRCCKKVPAVGIAFWAILLMSMGVIFNTILKMIACREIDNDYRMFYAGNNLCFDWSWYLHFAYLIALIGGFTYLWYRLYKYDKKRRQHPNFSMRTFILPYKPKYWYWEFVLLSRRFMVAFIALFPYTSKEYLNMLLLFIFTIYLSLHMWLRPFYHNENNYVEGVCLFCSICVISIIGFITTDDDGDNFNRIFKSSLVTLFILVPMMYFIYYVTTICCYKYYNNKALELKLQSDNGLENGTSNNMIELMVPETKQINSNSMENGVDGNRATIDYGKMKKVTSEINVDPDDNVHEIKNGHDDDTQKDEDLLGEELNVNNNHRASTRL